MERRRCIRAIRWAFDSDGPVQEGIRKLVNSYPDKQKQILFDRILKRCSWSVMQDSHHYTERQLRNILNAALDEIGCRVEESLESYYRL